jgi:hypothetical protein
MPGLASGTSSPRCLRAVLLVALALAMLPAAHGDEQLDEMMQNMHPKATSRAGVQQALRAGAQAVAGGISAVQNQVSNWLSTFSAPPPQDSEDLDAALDASDDTDLSLNARFWAEVRKEAADAEDAIRRFPFKHPWWAPSIVGDYMENVLNPAIDQVMNNDDQ